MFQSVSLCFGFTRKSSGKFFFFFKFRQISQNVKSSSHLFKVYNLMAFCTFKMCNYHYVPFFQIIYYFWLCQVFVAVCGLSLVLANRSYSSLWWVVSLWWLLLQQSMCSRCMGSVVGACRLQSIGSVVAVHRPSCPSTCGIFPGQGLKLCPLHWQADSLDHQGSPLSNSKHFHHPKKKPKAIKQLLCISLSSNL